MQSMVPKLRLFGQGRFARLEDGNAVTLWTAHGTDECTRMFHAADRPKRPQVNGEWKWL